jgi:SpoVK/Ycf46/Vps4 family AAA+-type ATPase
MHRLRDKGDNEKSFDDIFMKDDDKATLTNLISLATSKRSTPIARVLFNKFHINGVIISGASGSGKSLIGQVISNNPSYNTLFIDYSKLSPIPFRQSAKHLKAIFDSARELYPCVLFIDNGESFVNRWMDSPVAVQLVHEMNHPRMSKKNPLVIVTTGTDYELHDKVIGCFPYKISLPIPSVDGRRAILELILRDVELDESVSLESIAEKAHDFYGADLFDLCRNATLSWVTESSGSISDTKHTGEGDCVRPAKIMLCEKHFTTAFKNTKTREARAYIKPKSSKKVSRSKKSEELLGDDFVNVGML